MQTVRFQTGLIRYL